jgi:hypothetical protein
MTFVWSGSILAKKTPYTVEKVNDFPVPSRDVTNQALTGREYLIIPGQGEFSY